MRICQPNIQAEYVVAATLPPRPVQLMSEQHCECVFNQVSEDVRRTDVLVLLELVVLLPR
jgi:hypothetical protein